MLLLLPPPQKGEGRRGEVERSGQVEKRRVDSVTNWPVSRLMMNSWLAVPRFPALVLPPPP